LKAQIEPCLGVAIRQAGHPVPNLAAAVVPRGWAGLRAAIPGHAQRCKREQAASEEMVRHGRIRAEAFALKERPPGPYLVKGLKTASDVNEETSLTNSRQYLEFVQICE
jgi:hypothetical protein